jgi:chorismate mutase
VEHAHQEVELATKVGIERKTQAEVAFGQANADASEAKGLKGKAKGLSPELIDTIFKAIHQESINHQMKVMNNGVKSSTDKKK